MTKPLLLIQEETPYDTSVWHLVVSDPKAFSQNGDLFCVHSSVLCFVKNWIRVGLLIVSRVEAMRHDPPPMCHLSQNYSYYSDSIS